MVTGDQVRDSSVIPWQSLLTQTTVIVSDDGGWLSTIDRKGTGNSNFYYPQGLALDPHGNIHFVEDASIKVLTEESKVSF